MPYDPSQVRALRAKRDLTEVELADRAGLSRGTVSAMQKDGADPKVSTLTAVAKALGVHERTFFSPSLLSALNDEATHANV